MRILCLPYTHTLFHISRPLAIAIELRQRGHEVAFAGDSSKDHFIKSEGFQVLPLYQVMNDVLFERIRQGKLKFVTDHDIGVMIAADRDLYRQVKPDLVLSDGRFSAPLSCGIDGLLHTVVVNVSSTACRKFPYIPFFEWLPEQFFPREGRSREIFDKINLAIEMFVFDNATSIFKKLTKQLHLASPVAATNCLAGKALTLLADIAEYFPVCNQPSEYHYIGPLTWMGGDFSRLYRTILNRNLSAVISTGRQAAEIKSTRLDAEAAVIYIEDYVDGDRIIELADVVVCHGGNGTIYQALRHGKPIVGIPTIPDQAFNMRRVSALGVGETLPMKLFNKEPEQLIPLVAAVAKTPSYREHAEKIKKSWQH